MHWRSTVPVDSFCWYCTVNMMPTACASLCNLWTGQCLWCRPRSNNKCSIWDTWGCVQGWNIARGEAEGYMTSEDTTEGSIYYISTALLYCTTYCILLTAFLLLSVILYSMHMRVAKHMLRLTVQYSLLGSYGHSWIVSNHLQGWTYGLFF